MAHTTDMIPQGTPGHGHEHENKDASIRGILIFAVCLTISAVVIHLGLLGWIAAFRVEERRINAARPELFDDEIGQYPGPHLQDNPARDMMQMTEAELTRLRNYGWIEPGKVARIPIDRAMEIVASRGVEEKASEAVGPGASGGETGNPPQPDGEPASGPEGKPRP